MNRKHGRLEKSNLVSINLAKKIGELSQLTPKNNCKQNSAVDRFSNIEVIVSPQVRLTAYPKFEIMTYQRSSEPRFEPESAGCEARTLPLCYADPLLLKLVKLICSDASSFSNRQCLKFDGLIKDN
jgi:hypothetical protein